MDMTTARRRNKIISFADMALQSAVLQNEFAQRNRQCRENDELGETTILPCNAEASTGRYDSSSAGNISDEMTCNDGTVSTSDGLESTYFLTDRFLSLRYHGYLVQSLACFAMAVGATAIFEFALSDFGVTFLRPVMLVMQIFSFVFLFCTLATYLRSTWRDGIICVIFCVCMTIEFLFGFTVAQERLDTGYVQPVLTFVILLIVGGVSMILSLDVVRSAFFVTGIGIIRFLASSLITDLPQWLRPILAYCSGVVGVVAARYVVIALHSVSDSYVDVSKKRAEENGVSMMQTRDRKFQPGVATRRISLPNLTRKNAGISSSTSMESTLLMKAEGLLTDMIADPVVPRHIVRGLRAVKTLLKQSSPTIMMTTTTYRSKSNPLVSLSSGSALAQNHSDHPYTVDYSRVYSNKGLPRTLPVALSRCRSAGTWTTTTSATGMPSLESELLNEAKFHGSNSFSRLDKNWTLADERIDSDTWSRERLGSTERDQDELLESAELEHHRRPDICLHNDQNHCENASTPTDSRKDASKPLDVAGATRQHHITFADNTETKLFDEDNEFDIFDELQNDDVLDIEKLNQWQYQIFELADKAPDTILCRTSYKIFKKLRFFETFSIPVQEFLNYFHALELGYHDNPYHNRIHATDVLHAVYYMTTQSLPGFTQVVPDDDYKSVETESDNIFDPSYTDADEMSSDADRCMRTNFLPLELMALYTAAAMHDYDHPGRTNAFLVTTCNPLAVLYNNRSVLENHHASAGWRLFLSSQKYAWLVNLNNAQFKRFRFLVIEAILATDLARHFDMLTEFNAKVNDDDGSGIDWSAESDRQIVINMLIKMADINGPCKPKELHTKWTNRISEEFYIQGDEEESLGLTISPYMNRHQAQLAQLQESFIRHLVAPLCQSLSGAGLLPGYLADEQDESTTSINGDDFKGQLSNVEVVCPMIKNLTDNHQMWMKLIEEESKHKTNVTAENTLQQDGVIPNNDDDEPSKSDSETD